MKNWCPEISISRVTKYFEDQDAQVIGNAPKIKTTGKDEISLKVLQINHKLTTKVFYSTWDHVLPGNTSFWTKQRGN